MINVGKKAVMKITINIEDALYLKLKQLIPNRQISKFISGAIQKALLGQESELVKAYQDAYNDNQRRAENKKWEALEEINNKDS